MKTKIECPIDFIKTQQYNLVIDEDPECLIVDPGTSKFLDQSYFSSYNNLKIVGTPSTGVSHIDMVYLAQKNIKTFCLLDDRENLNKITASAEYTWLHIMNGFRKFNLACNNTSGWRNLENENLLRTNELSDKNILIIGLGRIGKNVKKYAQAFKMNITYYDPYVQDDEINRVYSLKNLLKYDCICVSCYLNNETRGLVDKDFLSETKENVILINTSRGEVVNENELCNRIINSKMYYGCDVLCNEQNIEFLKKSKLYNLSKVLNRVVVTPHVAGATFESQTKAFDTIIKLCRQYYERNF